jgi:nucleosome assembly protein 1-like 1
MSGDEDHIFRRTKTRESVYSFLTMARPPPEEEDLEDGADEGGGEGEGDGEGGGESDGGSTTDDEDDPMAHLPSYVVARVGRLRELNEQQEGIMEKYLEERAALEHKFFAQLKPLRDERACVVRGDKDDEIKTPPPKEEDNAAAAATDDDSQPKVKGIPQFWLCAMTHVETVGELVTELDVDCLEKLMDITCDDDADGKGFTLKFHFAPNDYFHDSVLTKRYVVPNLLLSDEPILKNVEGCTIQWKPDKSLTFRQIKKKQRGKGKQKGQVRTVTKKEDTESFFRWFDAPKLPSMETMDEEEAEAVEELFDHDYEVALAFRRNIIPHAVLWFTGEVREIIRLSSCGTTL